MIKFKNVSKIYSNDLVAVNNISFEVKKGETLVLLGTSGSGKTTTMRMINKLVRPTAGQIFIDEENIEDIDSIELRRKIGYAIQYIGFFNHMSVFENISIVPKLLKWDKDRIKKRVDDLLKIFGFEPDEYKNRFPFQLSGGEKQRIGVLRAIAANPPIILMDEPFGSLDPITREQVQNEFIELETDIQKTVVFVTHDVFEAVKMADRIALMDGGKILQIATPKELVSFPKNELVKQFLGRHKFQLSLMTTTIKEFLDCTKSDKKPNFFEEKYKLTPRSSIIDALDFFKETKKTALAIFDRKNFMGYLQKKDLLDSISNLLNSYVFYKTYQHMQLSLYSLFLSILIAVPLGIILAKSKHPKISAFILKISSILQTIPSLALIALIVAILVLLRKIVFLPATGFLPAIIVLSLYSILPILANTYYGIKDVNSTMIDVAKGMGMTEKGHGASSHF